MSNKPQTQSKLNRALDFTKRKLKLNSHGCNVQGEMLGSTDLMEQTSLPSRFKLKVRPSQSAKTLFGEKLIAPD